MRGKEINSGDVMKRRPLEKAWEGPTHEWQTRGKSHDELLQNYLPKHVKFETMEGNT